MDAAFQIIAGGAQVAQLLGLDDLVVFRRGGNLGLFRGDHGGVDLGQLGLSGAM